MNIYRFKDLALAAMTVALAAGCTKEVDSSLAQAPLTFGTQTAGSVTLQTKGEIQTSVTSFDVKAFDSSNALWFPKGSDGTSVSTGTTYASYRWPYATSLTFYGYANSDATGMSCEISNTGVSLTVTDASSQTDVLLGKYSGTGTKGRADMHFYHAMSALQFQVGTVGHNITAISGVSVSGLYSQGSTSLGASPTFYSDAGSIVNFAWTGLDGSMSVSQTGLAVTSMTANTNVGVPFILIPQNFSNVPVTVLLTVTLDGVANSKVSATINDCQVVPGKKTVCKINYDDVYGLSFSSEVVPWASQTYETDTGLEDDSAE